MRTAKTKISLRINSNQSGASLCFDFLLHSLRIQHRLIKFSLPADAIETFFKLFVYSLNDAQIAYILTILNISEM